jgi:2-haloacid dehalogenase
MTIRADGRPTAMLDLSSFRVISFDCYGTLIDWETGILGCMRPILDAHGQKRSNDEILELYGKLELAQESATYLPYRRVLENIVRGFGEAWDFTPTHGEIASLPQSLKSWQPFPDTVAALQALHTRYRLAVISNIDDDLFAATAKLLEVPLDYVITAEQAGSYKPSHRNFELALQRIGCPKRELLHVAQSRYHDIVPARALGIANIWINRQKKQADATVSADVKPDLELPDLASLAQLADGSRAHSEAR